MTVQLNNSERLVINQLLDTGLFTSKPYKPTNEVTNAIKSMKKPQFQKRISIYLRDLIGMAPENVQENILLLFGNEYENSENIHVLLATLKAVINLPELQVNQKDRSVLTQTIVRQVHSEVIDLDEKEIRRIINQLFVDRFKLFTLDYPELTQSNQSQEVAEYWNVNPNFNQVAQAIVNQLLVHQELDLNDEQKLNRLLLNSRFISRESNFTLWNYLMDHKDSISQSWKNLNRFDLEIGDNYALLLDTKRQQVKSKPSVVAIAVAKAIHTGVSENNSNDLIKEQTRIIFPKNSIALSAVKEVLMGFGLIKIKNEFIFPTPLIQRFSIEKNNRGNDDE
ncbi:hypothetical protein CPEBRM1_ABPJDJAI_01403 [Companilactobacillus paralimentarius]|uniref:hypothetical protein n=1 Tax=Companilactobacillus paralimentarius TaxID=83526 RepID=UPI00384C48DF